MEAYLFAGIVGWMLGMMAFLVLCVLPFLLLSLLFSCSRFVCRAVAALTEAALSAVVICGLSALLPRGLARRGRFLRSMHLVENETCASGESIRTKLVEMRQACEEEHAGLEHDIMRVDLGLLPKSLGQPMAEYRRIEGLSRIRVVETCLVPGGEAWGCPLPDVTTTSEYPSEYEEASAERSQVRGNIENALRDLARPRGLTVRQV